MQHAGDKDHCTVSWYRCAGLVYNTLQWYLMWGDVVQNRCKRSSPICASPRSIPRAGPEVVQGSTSLSCNYRVWHDKWDTCCWPEEGLGDFTTQWSTSIKPRRAVTYSQRHMRINCEKFICCLYPAWRTHRALLTNLKFCHRSALLPPTSDSTCQHARRATYQNLHMENGINCMALSAFPQRKCLGEDRGHPRALLYDIFNTIWRVMFWAFVLQNCYFSNIFASKLDQPQTMWWLIVTTVIAKKQLPEAQKCIF